MKFTAIIYDPEESSRMRLKSATTIVEEFESVTPCASERGAMAWLEQHQKVNLVFISEKIPAKGVRNFIAAIKESPKGALASFIIVKSSTSGGISPPDAILLGADGILCEPFSVDNMMEIVALANRLSREREQVHRRLGATLLIADMISEIDAAAFLKSQGAQAERFQRSLEALKEKTRALVNEDPDTYYAVLLRLTEAARPTQAGVKTKLYRGASNRVRRKAESKLVAEIAEILRLKDSGKTET